MLFFNHPRGICPWGCAATHWKSDLCHLESWNGNQLLTSDSKSWSHWLKIISYIHKIETAVDESYEVDQIDMRFLKVMISIHGYPLNSTRPGELAGATGYQAGWRNAKSELGGRNNKMRLKQKWNQKISIFHFLIFWGRIFFWGGSRNLRNIVWGKMIHYPFQSISYSPRYSYSTAWWLKMIYLIVLDHAPPKNWLLLVLWSSQSTTVLPVSAGDRRGFWRGGEIRHGVGGNWASRIMV